MKMNDDAVFERLLAVVKNHYSSRKSGKFLEYKSPEELGKILDVDAFFRSLVETGRAILTEKEN